MARDADIDRDRRGLAPLAEGNKSSVPDESGMPNSKRSSLERRLEAGPPEGDAMPREEEGPIPDAGELTEGLMDERPSGRLSRQPRRSP